MKVIKCQQASPEWWEARRGVPTASGFKRIVTSKGNLSKQADGYMAELIADIASLNPNFFTSRGTQAMRNGQQTEPEARRWYEMHANVDVTQVGFCLTDDERFGCSPDGLVGDDGGLELKCCDLKTHAAWMIKDRLPPEYKVQVHGCLFVTGRKWWDFCSYAVGLEPFVIRVVPDEFTAALAKSLDEFWVKFEEMKAKVNPPTPYSLAVAAWKKWLRDCGDSVVEFNKGLPNMAGMAFDLKQEVWRLSQMHAQARGWTFDATSKQFLPVEQPAF